MGLNPLELKPTPDRVLQSRGDDASPLKERREQILGRWQPGADRTPWTDYR